MDFMKDEILSTQTSVSKNSKRSQDSDEWRGRESSVQQ